MHKLSNVFNADKAIIKSISFDVFERYIQYLDVKPKTIETYTKALKQFAKYLYVKGITQPTREDIIHYRSRLRENNYKPTTIQNYITAVKLFFAWTHQEGIYPNVAEHLKGAKLDKTHKKDYLTSQQVKDVLDAIGTSTVIGARDYAILLLMITGGLRTIEVSRANIGDMRTNGNNTVLYIQGKGKEEKTDYIILSKPVERAIRSYLTFRKHTSDTQPLFASVSNNSAGKRLSTRSISGIAKTRMQQAGYNSERLTAHSLRHTAVTLSLLAGKDITEVQQFARHANINTTMIYNHSLEKSKNSCSDAITQAIL